MGPFRLQPAFSAFPDLDFVLCLCHTLSSSLHAARSLFRPPFSGSGASSSSSLLLFMVNTCLLTLKAQLRGHLFQEAIHACLLPPPKLGYVPSSGTVEVPVYLYLHFSVILNILRSSPLGSALHKGRDCILCTCEYLGPRLGPYVDTVRTSIRVQKEGRGTE